VARRDGSTSTGRSGTAATSRNEVDLVGRLAAPAQERVLPSGDTLLSWRLVVDRPPGRRPPPEGVRTPSVDTIDCVAWSAKAQRSALRLDPGDVVAVTGALRRRFWRTATGAASRTEVEVEVVRRV
jgi:single-strand DNA-binding protein